jgi:hypothetical protein
VNILWLGPDSRASYFNLTDVRKAIDFNQQSIRLTYQFIPLSFHFYAFKIHQGMLVIKQSLLLCLAKSWIASS